MPLHTKWVDRWIFSLPFGCATALMDEFSSRKINSEAQRAHSSGRGCGLDMTAIHTGRRFLHAAFSVTGVAGFEVRGAKAHVLRGITAGCMVRFYWTIAGLG